MHTRSLVRHTIALAALACFAAANVAHAQNFYPNDTTISTDQSTTNAVVGYANLTDLTNGTNPTSPTFNLVNGGALSGIDTYNSSVTNITGGNVVFGFHARDTAIVNVSGGHIGGGGGGFQVSGNSVITISGGTFDKFFGVNFIDFTQGSFTLIGYDLTATNVGPANIFGGTNYALTGTLQNGTDVNGYILNVQTGAKPFTLQNAAVPEPGSVALLVGMVTVGAGFVGKRRRVCA